MGGLNDVPGYRVRGDAIESMPRLNLKTVRAYHIRENFQEIYKEESPEGFEEALKKWYFWVTHSRIDPVKLIFYTFPPFLPLDPRIYAGFRAII